VSGPGAATEATHGDDSICKAEEGVDDGDPAFVAAYESVERILPDVGALYMHAPGGLDGSLLAPV
jgi:hypothetical protein